jgi:hypothetical protein
MSCLSGERDESANLAFGKLRCSNFVVRVALSSAKS